MEIDILNREIKADLKIVNCKILDVFNGMFVDGEVVINNGKIISFEDLNANEIIDAKGQYLIPGLIDCHMHIESSMLTPKEYAKVALKNGVMTVFADPHEIANVMGNEGVEFIIKEIEDTLIDINLMAPSTVPCMKNIEGNILNSIDLLKYYDNERIMGLSEVMDIKRVENKDEDYLKKLKDAKSSDKVIDGHMIGFTNKQIDIARNVGIENDHETVDISDMKDKLMRGVKVFLREGTVAKDFQNLIKGVSWKNHENISLCSDDIEVEDLLENGSINRIIKKGIKMGIDPCLLLKLATYNGAKAYNLKNKGAVSIGYDADLLLISDLYDFKIEKIIKNGKLITEEELTAAETIINDKYLLNTNNIIVNLNIDDIKNIPDISIEITAGTLVTKKVQYHQDDNIVLVINRYGNKNYTYCGLRGFNLQKGVIATTISHDSHNLVMVGKNLDEIIEAFEIIKKSNGGLYYFIDNKMMSLNLDIAGLLSTKGYVDVYNEHKEIVKAVKKNIDFATDPFLAISFITLPVIPDIKILAEGIYLFEENKFINKI